MSFVYDVPQSHGSLGYQPHKVIMKRTWTIIGVADVARSYRWYQTLFGQPTSAPAHDYFGQILDTEVLSRARSLVGELEAEPRMNPATGTQELALRDPDGYYVMISALS